MHTSTPSRVIWMFTKQCMRLTCRRKVLLSILFVCVCARAPTHMWVRVCVRACVRVCQRMDTMKFPCFDVIFIVNAFGHPYHEEKSHPQALLHPTQMCKWYTYLHNSFQRQHVRHSFVQNNYTHATLKRHIQTFCGHTRSHAYTHINKYVHIHVYIHIYLPQVHICYCF